MHHTQTFVSVIRVLMSQFRKASFIIAILVVVALVLGRIANTHGRDSPKSPRSRSPIMFFKMLEYYILTDRSCLVDLASRYR